MQKKMNRSGLQISVIFLLLFSLAGFSFFSYKIFASYRSGQGAQIKVEGVKNENKNGERGDFSGSKLTFEQLYAKTDDAPVKKSGFGDVYVRAKSSIVIDAETGTILHYQDGKKKMAIASLTKIMTAILAVENIKNLKEEAVTIDSEVTYSQGTIIGCPRSGYCISNRLAVGEKISAQNLLEAMLMNSANDAALALGKHIAGSNQTFARMMNDKAKEIGLTDSHFCNPSGLDDDDNPGSCYSSAYDLARITAYSMKYDEIWDIMKIKEKEIYSLDGRIVHRIVNTDVLLDQMPNCLGGKTGFTYEAGKSLMMAAHHPSNKEHKAIAVILDADYRWEDMKNLLSWTFSAYNWQ